MKIANLDFFASKIQKCSFLPFLLFFNRNNHHYESNHDANQLYQAQGVEKTQKNKKNWRGIFV